MTKSNLIYDIRTSEYAQQTLANLTGVPISIWKQYSNRKNEYEYTENLVADVVNSYGYLPNNYMDFDFICFHVTTSANECLSFRKNGILDLKQSYMCCDSELRQFLENHDIHIQLDNKILTYHNKVYDITYRKCPRNDIKNYKCWSIGRKFYFDYTICGFLSVRKPYPYLGYVHKRPEILKNIDDLLGLNLSKEWESIHKPYEITVKINGQKIVYCGDDTDTSDDKVINYLTKAYHNAFNEPSEEEILMKNHVKIPSSDIIDISSLQCWKLD